ncbi:MAG: hypothetical protein ABIN79_13090 [Marmoricola sp.]
MIETVLVLPTPRVLLAPYSRNDPVAALRTACHDAVDSVLAASPRRLAVLATAMDPANQERGVTDPLGFRVARHLLGRQGTPRPTRVDEHVALPYAAATLIETPEPTTLLVMADGSASRGEKAPGHLHPQAIRFDDAIALALRTGDAQGLAVLDPVLGEQVWCTGVPAFQVLGEVARGRRISAEVTYDDAPFGVAWWVARWDLG